MCLIYTRWEQPTFLAQFSNTIVLNFIIQMRSSTLLWYYIIIRYNESDPKNFNNLCFKLQYIVFKATLHPVWGIVMTADCLFNLKQSARGVWQLKSCCTRRAISRKQSFFFSLKIRERHFLASRCRRRPRAMPQYSLYFHNRARSICENLRQRLCGMMGT